MAMQHVDGKGLRRNTHVNPLKVCSPRRLQHLSWVFRAEAAYGGIDRILARLVTAIHANGTTTQACPEQGQLSTQDVVDSKPVQAAEQCDFKSLVIW